MHKLYLLEELNVFNKIFFTFIMPRSELNHFAFV